MEHRGLGTSHGTIPEILFRSAASPWTCRLIRLGLAGMFFAAGVLKMADVGGFTETIRAFGMVPWSLAPVLAVALPVLEVASGVGLALNYRWAHFLAAGMLLVFMAVLLRAKTLGLDIDCGCYGPSDPEAEAFASIDSSLYRDAFMLAALGLVWWRRRAFGEGARSS